MADKNFIKQIVSDLGGPTAVAKKLDISAEAVCRWQRENKVPANRCPAIVELTNGGYTLSQLNPDVFGKSQIQRAA